MKECGSTKLETLVVKQKNNGTVCVSMLIITYSRKPQVNNFHLGARKDGRGNEPVGSCAMCDARSTGPRVLEGKNR